MPIFGKPGCPFIRREGRDPITPEAFLDFVGSYFEQASLSSDVLTGEDLHAAALAKKATSGGRDGWGWTELSRLYRSPGMWGWPGFFGWLRILGGGLGVCWTRTLL